MEPVATARTYSTSRTTCTSTTRYHYWYVHVLLFSSRKFLLYKMRLGVLNERTVHCTVLYCAVLYW
jgi:hypothetical protein